jgi:hypothetical protein
VLRPHVFTANLRKTQNIGSKKTLVTPDLPHLLKELQGIYIVIISKVNNAIELVVLDVSQCNISLMDPTVLNICDIFLTYKMPVHYPSLP